MKGPASGFIFLLAAMTLMECAYGQLIFPEGKQKKMITNQSVIYEETKVPFVYPGGRVVDLNWKKLSDSVPANWFIMACMNGTCLGGTPDSGQFDNFLNNPDSIGFLKYHFDFRGTPGSAMITYIISGRYLSKINDTITFNITYSGSSVIQKVKYDTGLNISPNPVSGSEVIVVLNNNFETFLKYTISDISGKELIRNDVYPVNGKFYLDLSSIREGVYFLRINTGENILTVKINKL